MKITKTLMLLGASIIILSSCSQQRYAHRVKVKKGNQETLAVRKHKDIKTAPITAKTEELPIAANQEIVKQIPVTKSPQTNADKPSAITQIKQHVEENIEVIRDKAENVQRPIKRLKKLDKQDSASDPFSSKWFRVMIIGLIIAILGTILGWLILGPIGGIISAVGGLIFLIGLILWLVDLVA